jgi:hypothetical protein
MKRSISLIRRLFTHELSGFLILGLLLRIVLMPYFIWPYDIGAYQSALAYLMSGNDPYAVHASIYPPFVHFITYPLFRLAYQLGVSFDFHSIQEVLTGTRSGELVANLQVSPLFLILWKVPLLCFDLLTGILIYCFVKSLVPDSKMAKRCFLIWLFNPFTLAVSYLNGSYDIVVGFFILLGAFFLFKGNYFSAGLSFGLGTLAKTSPIFVAIPLSIIVLFTGLRNSFHSFDLRTNAGRFLKFAVGCVVPIVFFAPLFIEYANLMYSGISKEVSILGGLNQWFFAADQNRSYLLNQHIGVIQTVFSYYPVICFALALFLSWVLELKRESTLLSIAFFTGLMYLFLPITLQPQYLLWIMPLLVVLSCRWRSLIWSIGIFSVAGFFFYMSLQGPQTFLYPLAMYTRLYSPQELISNIVSYQNSQGIISQYLRQDLSIIFGGIGFLGQIVTMALLIRNMRRTKNDIE